MTAESPILTERREAPGVAYLRLRGTCPHRGRFDSECLVVNLSSAPRLWHRCGDVLVAATTADRCCARTVGTGLLAEFSGAGVVGCPHPGGTVVVTRAGATFDVGCGSREAVLASLADAFSRWSCGLGAALPAD
ncbi:hypothetical protein [Amycolatopsis magusensis]|uniref:hypothetical protein n=1 Tax=Amycolatopsis magusensis TaxID=882444 RepID=UPI003C2BB8AC